MGIDTSSSGYIKIPVTQLPDVRLKHLTSAIDMSIRLPETVAYSSHLLTGYTEWTACWNGQDISVGWDWAFVNSEVILIHADEIRSNVQLFEDDGTTTSPAKTRHYLAIWLESLPWRDGSVRQLVQRNWRPTP
jgi:hypothetical protein